MPNSNTRTEPKAAPEKPQESAGQKASKGDKSDGTKRKWDIIDEHAWESFPASDPPASWAGRDIAPQEREESIEEQPTKKQATSVSKKQKEQPD